MCDPMSALSVGMSAAQSAASAHSQNQAYKQNKASAMASGIMQQQALSHKIDQQIQEQRQSAFVRAIQAQAQKQATVAALAERGIKGSSQISAQQAMTMQEAMARRRFSDQLQNLRVGEAVDTQAIRAATINNINRTPQGGNPLFAGLAGAAGPGISAGLEWAQMLPNAGALTSTPTGTSFASPASTVGPLATRALKV